MKWLSNRYTYPLVALVILITTTLQLIWLRQLFLGQRIQAKRDLEHAVANAARVNTYLSEVHGHEQSGNFRDFFLSPNWLAFQQAYANIRFENVGSRYNADTKGDSTIIDISLRFKNGNTPLPRHRHSTRFEDDMTLAQLTVKDTVDFRRMDSLVHIELQRLGVGLAGKGWKIDFDINSPDRNPVTGMDSSAVFKSGEYSYNLDLLNTYQLSVPSIDKLVFYRMRYYLFSALLMVVLTVAGFIFVLRLLHKQRLYTEARLSFTSNMTHELKTPVATVAVALESIIGNTMNGDPVITRNYLEISLSELRRLTLMIDKVLNLDQVDNGQARLREELFDVQPAIEKVVASMQVQIRNAGARISWEPWPDPCFVSGDPVHLTNVFYNLIENALKYGGTGVSLEISCRQTGGQVVIGFKDNGPGIPAIYQGKVFDRFFRVPHGSADVHNVKGTGLGLNYVKETISRHRGRITLTSATGKGSNFILYLPSAI